MIQTLNLVQLRIALILCINVLWMAFELQLYGSVAGARSRFVHGRNPDKVLEEPCIQKQRLFLNDSVVKCI